MSNNSIGFLTNTMISLTSLNVLTMNHNKLTNIDFRRLPEGLTDLSLRNNYITTVHYVPQSARNLRRIDLSGNQLDFIVGSGSVNMLPPSLKQADLSHNQITFIQEGALGHMKELALLDLKGNRLTELKEGSLSGPQNQLRMFLEGNPFQCHCGLQWLLHVKTKTAPIVLDLPTLTCTPLLDESQVLNLTVADRMNQLTCKYDKLCPLSCTCCEDDTCSCRSSCPPQCHCYRSANMESRSSLASISSLKRLQLTSNTLSRIPPRLGRLTYLQLANNSLTQLTADDIKVLNTVKRVSLGGNTSSFSCDCETPSPLQLWLREKKNRDKNHS
ncbi:leucine Rich repeat-containing domain protein [Ostertagia ostertagi]